VVSGLPFDRHPAVLARDVTTLDVLSSGRAAVTLRWAGTREYAGSSRDCSAVCAYLGEATAVCRAVLQDENPAFEGRYLRIAGAVNQPLPVRSDRLPLLVEIPNGIAGRADCDPGASFLVRQATAAATAIVCSDDPREIATWRARLANGKGATSPRIICRTSLGREAALSTRDTVCSSAVSASASAASAFAAGADGIIVRLSADLPAEISADLPAGLYEGAQRSAYAGAAARVAEQISSCFDPWRR
jgi:alkanesulfonate monooxygenase SsuD/methylene tetrahydromethanopterin reductase-like flavin-dependent oxidoreductase (luciferase family)